MVSATTVAKGIGALAVGLILAITLYEPIYLLIGNLLEGALGVSKHNPAIAELAAELLSPMCGGYMTVKLAPQPKNKAILWTPTALLIIAVVGVTFGDISSISLGQWLSALVFNLLGSLFGGGIAARGSE